MRGPPLPIPRRHALTAAAAFAVLTGAIAAAAVPEHPRSAYQAQVTQAAPPATDDVQARQVLPLAGKVIGIDPGHNGGNFNDPGYLSQLIWNGRAWETCDTTGTETDAGYTEARYNFQVATFLRADLIKDGARVVMTRTSNSGVGPCVNRRSQIINAAHASVAIDIHADGGPPGGRGFAILEPVSDGPNDKIIKASERFGALLRSAFLAGTGMPVSTYDGVNGINFRDDLAGLNLTTVPKVLIECGNMRNATDARQLTSTRFQQAAARAMAAAIVEFVR
jgi:N-acetylmuramoyl-L-alanine amidase